MSQYEDQRRRNEEKRRLQRAEELRKKEIRMQEEQVKREKLRAELERKERDDARRREEARRQNEKQAEFQRRNSEEQRESRLREQQQEEDRRNARTIGGGAIIGGWLAGRNNGGGSSQPREPREPIIPNILDENILNKWTDGSTCHNVDPYYVFGLLERLLMRLVFMKVTFDPKNDRWIVKGNWFQKLLIYPFIVLLRYVLWFISFMIALTIIAVSVGLIAQGIYNVFTIGTLW